MTASTLRPSRHPLFARLRALAAALVLVATATAIQATPVPVPAPLRDALSTPKAEASWCAAFPNFTGYLTGSSSSTTMLSRTKTGSVYSYISNVVATWSCTAYYRYSGLAWNTASTTGSIDWGDLIDSTSIACNWVVGTTDYLKANGSATCPTSDAQYAMNSTLPQGVYQRDVNHNSTGDVSYAHSACGTYYYGSKKSVTGQSFSTSNAGNRPGANCDPLVLDDHGYNQTIVVDGTAPTISFSAPAANGDVKATAYTVTFSATDNVAGFSGSNGWSLQRQVAPISSPNVCGTFANDTAAGNLTTGVTAGANSVAQSLAGSHCYRWVLGATDQNGNTASPVTSSTVLVDVAAPVVTFSAPGAGTTPLNGTSYTIAWSETDVDSGVASRSVQRQVATLSGGVCGAYTNDGSPTTTASPLSATGLLDAHCYQWVASVTDTAGNTSTTTSGTLQVVIGTPAADFATPNEGTTTVTNQTSYTVAWSETSGGAYTITSRSLQRQKAAVVNPGTCTGVTWANDGAPYTGTSSKTETGLLTGTCYQWIETLTNSYPKTGSSTSGAVLVDTGMPAATLAYPETDRPLAGDVTATGTALDDYSFKEYQLDYGSGTAPSSWTTIALVSSPVATTGPLATWSTGGLNGVYTLRLTARDLAGNATVVTHTVDLENAGRGEESYFTRVPFDLGGGWGLDVGVANGEARLSRDLFSIPSYGPAQSLSLSYSSLETGAAGMFGVGWSSNLTQYLSFDVPNAITTWHRADGGRVPFGLVAGTWTPLGGHFETMYIASGEVTITAKDQTAYVFDSTTGRLKRIANRFGKALTMSWGASSATATDASGRATTLSIDATNSRITGVTDSAGRTWSFGYTGTGGGSTLTTVTDPATAATTLGYDASSRLSSVTRTRSRVTGGPETITWSVGYDSVTGKATTVTDPIDSGSASPDRNTISYASGTTTVGILQVYGASPVWNTSTYSFDSHGWITSLTDADGYTTRWNGYDANADPASIDRPVGDGSVWAETTYIYDGRGNVLTQTAPIDAFTVVVTTNSYNLTNDLLTKSEADNDASVKEVTKYSYDGGGHLISTDVNCTTSGTTPPTDASTCTGAGTQDASTNLVTNYAYTANDQLAYEQDPVGFVTKHMYDSWGNETSVIADCTSSGTTVPSPFNSCTGAGTVDWQTNVTTSSTFDQATVAGKAGLPTAKTDALGRVTSFTYDALGHQLTETLPWSAGDTTVAGAIRCTSYDEFGNVLTDKQSWTSGVASPPTDCSTPARTTTHAYDLVNRQTSVAVAGGDTTTSFYDAAGDEMSTTSGAVTTSRTFDGLGRATADSVDSGTTWTTHVFDAAGNETQTNPPTGNTIAHAFDYAGRATSDTIDPAGLNQATTHTYDRLGHETSSTDPQLAVTSHTYDRAGRQLTTTTAAGTVTSVYDRSGNVVATKQLDGSVTATMYDPLGRAVTSIASCTNSGTTQPPAGATCAGTGTQNTTTNLTTTTFYDATGVTIATTDPKGISSRTIPNARGLAETSIANCTDSGTLPTTNPRACVGGGTQDATTNVVTTTLYDGAGATTGSTVAVGTGAAATTTTFYDTAGRAQAVKDPMGTITRNLYNAAGQLTDAYVDCTTTGTTIPSDWANCTGLGTPDRTDGTYNLHTSYTYDAAGNQATETGPNGRVTAYQYDTSNRLRVQIDNDKDGVFDSAHPTEDIPTTTYYDTAGRVSAVVKLGGIDGATPITTRTLYDAAGRVIETIVNCTNTGTALGPSEDPGSCAGTGTNNDGVTNVATFNTYDTNTGNLVKVIGPDPSAPVSGTGTVTTRYGYDAANRLCRVLEASTVDDTTWNNAGCSGAISGTTTTNLSTRYTYDAVGNLASAIDAAGHTTAYAYDQAAHLTSTTDADGKTLVFAYNALGQKIRQENRSNPPATPSVTWTYDGAGRILTRTFGTVPALDQTAPTVPAGVNAVANAYNLVTVSWTAAADNVAVTSYRLYRSGTQITGVGGATTSFVDASVTPNATYTYTLAACDAAGNCSAQSTGGSATTPVYLPPVDTTAPGVPSGVNATANAFNQVSVSWTASTDNIGVTSYQIRRGGTQVATVDGSATSFVDRSLSPITTYSYTVSACDAAGNCSGQSTAGSATTPAYAGPADTQAPTAPTNVSATASAWNSVTITWTASSDNVGVTSYVVSRSNNDAGGIAAAIATVSGSTTTFIDNNPPQHVSSYTNYSVQALDAAGNASPVAWSNAVSAPICTSGCGTTYSFTPTADAYVDSKHASANYGTNTSLNVNNSGNPYQISYLKFDLSALPKGQVADYAMSLYQTSNTTGSYTCDLSGPSSWTETGITWNNQPNQGPYNWATSSLGANNTRVVCDLASLIAATPTVTSYQIGTRNPTSYSYSSREATNKPTVTITEIADSTAPSVPTGLTAAASSTSGQINLTWTASTDAATGVSGYNVYRNGAKITPVPVASVSYSDTGLTPGNAYTYTLTALDAAGNESGQSGGAAATAPSATPPADTTGPTVPTALTATPSPTTGGQLNLSWTAATDGGTGVQGYKLYRDGSLLTPLPVGSTSYTDTGLVYNSSHAYTVLAVDGAGNASAQGAGANGTAPYAPVPPDMTAPSVPSGLVAAANGPDRIDLGWSASTDNVGVQGYRLYRDAAYLTTVSSTGWSDTGLAAGSSHTYTVAAVDGAGNASAQSGSASATTWGSSQTTTYTYDANGNKLTASDGAETITATYDRLNRVLTSSDNLDVGGASSYTYSITSPTWTDPSGTYHANLDAFDRAVSLTDPVNTTPFTWSYRADGQRASGTQSNGNTVTYGYDGQGRPASAVAKTGATTQASYGWSRNQAGQILSEASTITSDPTNDSRAFTYDPLGRLTGFTDGTTTTSYTWDTVLNRTGVQVAGSAAVATTFDAANRPTGQNGQSGPAVFSSDADGRLTSRPTTAGAPYQHFSWDTIGRLTAVRDASGQGTIASYSYDPLDRLRLVDYGSGNRIRFRYTGITTSVAQEVNDATNSVIRSVGNAWTGEHLEDWTGAGSNLRVYGTNGHGDVTWTADSTGSVSGTVRYDPYGTATSVTGSVPDFRFQGSWADDTTKLSWVVTRWYAPAQGDFVSEDSVLGTPRDPDSRHLYAYGAGDPVGRADTNGMYWYRVRRGDTLWSIARRKMGGAYKWTKLLAYNTDRVSNPRRLRIGTCLWIPRSGRNHCYPGLPETDAPSPTPQPAPPPDACIRNPDLCKVVNPPPASIDSYGFCAAFSAGAGAGGSMELCVIQDYAYKHWAVLKIFGLGAYIGAAGGGSFETLLSTGKHVTDQGGLFFNIGLVAELGPAGLSGVEEFGWGNDGWPVTDFVIGTGLKGGLASTITLSYTFVDTLSSAVDDAGRQMGLGNVRAVVEGIGAARSTWNRWLGY